MITTNDALFCILHSCANTLESSRLIYYIYLFQLSKLDFKFKFRLNASGLVCRGLDELLDDLINQDKVRVNDDGVLYLTDIGCLYYDNVVLTLDEWEYLDNITSILDDLTEDELFFICITDMLVYGVLKKYGTDGLISRKDSIKSSIAALSSEYTEDNFNTALSFIRHIKGGFVDEK